MSGRKSSCRLLAIHGKMLHVPAALPRPHVICTIHEQDMCQGTYMTTFCVHSTHIHPGSNRLHVAHPTSNAAVHTNA